MNRTKTLFRAPGCYLAVVNFRCMLGLEWTYLAWHLYLGPFEFGIWRRAS